MNNFVICMLVDFAIAWGEENDYCIERKIFFDYILHNHDLSRIVRKPAFCICENKDADQLRGNREADQRLCFRYIGSTTPLLSKSEI